MRGAGPRRSLAEGTGRTAPQRKARRRRGGGTLIVPGALAGVGAAGYGVYAYRDELADTLFGRVLTGQYNRFYESYIKPLYMPASDTLLPDQDPSMRGRYTVVIDLENTLVSSTWDRKYGWRSVKRPGVDDLLAFLSQHCEVVLFSDKDHGMGSDTAMKLDPGQMLFHHQLHREYTRWMNGRLVKDMNMLNRDLRKVIVVDKDARAFSPTPSNGITVKPFSFKDQKDLEDRQLKTVTELIKHVVREGPEDVREVLSDLQSRGDDALKVFEEDCARREAEDKQKMERSVVNRLKASLDKKDAGKEAGTASTLPADQARLLEKRQQQQEQQLEQGGAQARTSNAVEDIRQAAERARAWALAQYTVGLVGMPPQAAYAERAAEAQEQAQSLSGMLGGAGGPQMPSAPPPPPKLPTKHATITGREPEAPTLWMRVKSWADEKQEEQQMIMADFQRQQMEAFQRQQMAEQAKKEQEQEQEYEARAREIAQKRNRIQRAKEAQQVQAQPDTA